MLLMHQTCFVYNYSQHRLYIIIHFLIEIMSKLTLKVLDYEQIRRWNNLISLGLGLIEKKKKNKIVY